MQNYVRFAHGPQELRIACFVYPGLHPYDYDVRMNSPNTLSSPYGRQSRNSHTIQHGVSNSDSSVESASTNNSPEMFGKCVNFNY
ncbi:unnamed protein product [Onchocerca flexuosa]|uniref:RHD domain-containing protein n=1 Tax=Onchocerca flexuosa TaxID=387005 RepID=A0A183HJL9_9BILA|nr:unnamed protein product [Onchocerca flexuosa]